MTTNDSWETYDGGDYDDIKFNTALKRSNFLPPFTKCRFVGRIVASNYKLGSFSLIDAVIEKSIEFSNIEFIEDVILTIKQSQKASISFKGCHFAKKLKIRNTESNSCENAQKNKIMLEKLEFIDCTIGNDGANIAPYFRVGLLHVKNFVLQNLRIPPNAEMNIGDCHFENFCLSNLRNMGKFKLYKINVQNDEKTENGIFQIDNTSIGDTDFQSLNLTSFKTRKIFDNILSGIDYTNVQWEEPSTNIEVGQCRLNSKTKIAKTRDTYRVLKNVAHRNNDTPQALAFYAKEMFYHHKLIKRNASLCDVIKLCKEGKMSNFLDRIVLGFGRWTNKFGQNWFLPIVWILFLGTVFYAFLLWLSCSEVFAIANWHSFPMFLDPTHKFESIYAGNWTSLAYILDLFFRILEGALIYQAIQAFRKYSRKF